MWIQGKQNARQFEVGCPKQSQRHLKDLTFEPRWSRQWTLVAVLPCFSGCLQRANGNAAATRDQTQAIKPADWSVWSRDRFCKLQAT